MSPPLAEALLGLHSAAAQGLDPAELSGWGFWICFTFQLDVFPSSADSTAAWMWLMYEQCRVGEGRITHVGGSMDLFWVKMTVQPQHEYC